MAKGASCKQTSTSASIYLDSNSDLTDFTAESSNYAEFTFKTGG
jgi:hypothetical protein